MALAMGLSLKIHLFFFTIVSSDAVNLKWNQINVVERVLSALATHKVIIVLA